MQDERELSQIIGDIYDAALDPDKWEAVLERACGFLRTMNASLVSFDATRRNLNMAKSWGYETAYLKSYDEYYQHINPAMAGAFRVQVGQVMIASRDDVLPYEEFSSSRIWHEWGAPQGYIDFMQVNLEKKATAVASFAAARHKTVGMYDDEALRRVQLLWPHFRRAVLIGKVIDLHKVEAAALADTLDGLAAAMILVDAGGRIAHANAAGNVMLAEGSVLRGIGGKLDATDVRANSVLYDIIANAENGDAALGGQGAAVPLSTREGDRYIAHVLPLTSGARRKAEAAYSAVAAVFVRKVDLEAPHPIDALADAFGLTPAELRVLMMIVRVGGVPEVAPVLGISEETVRTHLKRIFEKTDTDRQADLVKLVANYTSPLAS